MRYLLPLIFIITGTAGLQAQNFLDYYEPAMKMAEKGDCAGAIPLLDKAIRINNKVDEAYYNRGHCKAQIKEYKSAIKDFDTSLTINKSRVEAFYWRGKCYHEIGYYYEAARDFSIAIGMAGEDIEFLGARAVSLLKLHEYVDALKDFNTCLRFDSTRTDLYLGRAYCYYYLKRFPETIKDIRRYLKDKPQSPDALEIGMRTLFEMGDSKGAIQMGEQYASVPGYEYLGHYFVGTIHYAMKDYNSALNSFSKAITYNSLHAGSYYSRAACYLTIGNNDNACKDIQHAKQLGYTEIDPALTKACEKKSP